MYVDRRYAEMKKNVNPITSMVGMALRLGLLCLVLLCGKYGCDHLVNESSTHVSEYDLKQYTNSKLRIIRDLRAQGIITDKEVQERVRKLETNTKEQYLKEYR